MKTPSPQESKLSDTAASRFKKMAKLGALKKSPNQMRKDMASKLAKLKGF